MQSPDIIKSWKWLYWLFIKKISITYCQIQTARLFNKDKYFKHIIYTITSHSSHPWSNCNNAKLGKDLVLVVYLIFLFMTDTSVALPPVPQTENHINQGSWRTNLAENLWSSRCLVSDSGIMLGGAGSLVSGQTSVEVGDGILDRLCLTAGPGLWCT